MRHLLSMALRSAWDNFLNSFNSGYCQEKAQLHLYSRGLRGYRARGPYYFLGCHFSANTGGEKYIHTWDTGLMMTYSPSSVLPVWTS
jgi:hypothetical protein